ncbi:hypothetical protein HPB50_013430 [Hyalomma asiaticum]|uniref:Uncharacterized protein n=1 Tax=Hyalomma asiaticum TaxID=266040 RepID=A0ACB7SN64_HYAAI|nr:hypothetical protein HPB50_013430 [Hyalomma asiaticum]
MEKTRPSIRDNRSTRGLKFADTLRVLGVVFDRRLTFFHHADHLRTKVDNLSAKVSAFICMNWSLRPPAIRTPYRQVILPAITYASNVWWRPTPDCRLRARLASVQRSALLALTGAYKTTRTAALQVLAQAPPIELELERRNREVDLFQLKRPVQCMGATVDPRSILQPINKWSVHPAKDYDDIRIARLSAPEAKSIARGRGRHIYTDGSYTLLSSGAAYVIMDGGVKIEAAERYKVLGATSAYCVELVAFTGALDYVYRNRSSSPTNIYTDCLSLLQALKNPDTLEPRIDTIRRKISRVNRTQDVRIYHVPGHSGIYGNELADFLAARAGRLGRPRTAPCTRRAIKGRLKEDLLNKWARDWCDHSNDTELFKWAPDVRKIPQFFPPDKKLTTLLTGHGRFPSYFHRFGLLREPRCPCGQISDSIDHYFGHCIMTRDLVARIRPADKLNSNDRRDILKSPINRALLIQLVGRISDAMPDLNRT